ncbi:hypothetical protein SAMN05421678_109212 [Actinopolymorpha cephalotaxi]|uniref:Integral membrane protein n=1 Tax=Actinopolymorpha cephalotaxi TaxID=504797 RepID=A0A1I2VQS6_9ACTN|nr:hypothetical protein [Actinopolymorpha cephalotaxi]NYH83294.1 hypothetical protein [Actinopolymorpha cephalotaxi]SFG89541.1 hypothetical protein SAMN05421678_109212 [Actinopolymorpha cephalotaxi]
MIATGVALWAGLRAWAGVPAQAGVPAWADVQAQAGVPVRPGGPAAVSVHTPTADVDLRLTLGGRETVLWMLVSFLVTFMVTRTVTRLIRSGRGPFRDTQLGGVHVHHAVYGIFLMIGAATAEFAYRPEPPAQQVVAVIFAAGAALTLDEFALWLYLEDVYWTREGRRSVDAVLVAATIGILLLLGASPLDTTGATGTAAAAVAIATNLAFSLVAIAKGKLSTGLIGVFVPLVAMIAAFRLAKPNSPWAHRLDAEDSRRRARSRARYPADRRTWWDNVKDVIGGPPSPPPPPPNPNPPTPPPSASEG